MTSNTQAQLMVMNKKAQAIAIGDVVQINERYEKPGWIGAFVLVTELKTFGVMGFVHVIGNNQGSGRAYIILKWDVIDRIGSAALILQKETTDAE